MSWISENWKKALAALAVALLVLAGLVEPGGFIRPATPSAPDVTPFAGGSTGFDDLDLTGYLKTGGGYGSTGCTLSAAGALQCDGAATIGGELGVVSAAVGGGFGSTGCSISAAGVLQCDGAATLGSTLNVTGTATFVGAANADSTAIGGGFGSTGCSISAAGVLQCDGAATLGSTLNVTGTITGNVTGNVTGDITVDDLVLTAGSVVTVTDATPFTITAAVQPLTAAGTVTPTITIPAAGVSACVYNSGANTINIADASNQVLTAAWAGGQYDWLCFYSDGTRVMETGRADN